MAKGTCSVEGCERDADARGWCPMHYARWKRNGDPLLLASPLSVSDLFWRKVDTNGPIPEQRPDLGPCWPWTAGSDRKGYGRVLRRHGRSALAHRFAYEEMVGTVPDGRELDHLCFNRLCCNPAHLEPVTHEENLRRGDMGWRSEQTHCKHGHEFTPENTYLRIGKRHCRTCRREHAKARRP